MTSSTAAPLATVQSLYAAFGRGDLPALLDLLTDDVQWRFVADRASGYTAAVRGKDGVAQWLAAVAAADDIQAFEPRRMLAGDRHVTVLGWERTTARASARAFECEWVHVFELDASGTHIERFTGLLDSEQPARARP
jgi:hypothetical protein